jgi:hypothetical protein
LARGRSRWGRIVRVLRDVADHEFTGGPNRVIRRRLAGTRRDEFGDPTSVQEGQELAARHAGFDGFADRLLLVGLRSRVRAFRLESAQTRRPGSAGAPGRSSGPMPGSAGASFGDSSVGSSSKGGSSKGAEGSSDPSGRSPGYGRGGISDGISPPGAGSGMPGLANDGLHSMFSFGNASGRACARSGTTPDPAPCRT